MVIHYQNGNLEATVIGSSFTRQYIVNTIAPIILVNGIGNQN
jgi:hypothetical protein